MINGKNLVNDGLTSACKNNGRDTWSFNQGVILGGLVELRKVTGDADHLAKANLIAQATLKRLTSRLAPTSAGTAMVSVLLAPGITVAGEKVAVLRGSFALRLALSGHVGIPRENEFDFLTEAEAAFAPPEPKKKTTPAKEKKPTLVRTAPAKKAKVAKKQIAA